MRSTMKWWRTFTVALILLLPACAGSLPVPASCPTPPVPPKVVMETLSASRETSLIDEWVQHWSDFLIELRESFNAAKKPVSPSKPAPSGR